MRLAAAKRANTIVVVDFTATWCGPCQLMERTVWRDPRLEKWFQDHRAVAIRIDTDALPEIRKEYAISAWPTAIGYRGAELVDRRVGSMTSEQLLGWLAKIAGEDASSAPSAGWTTKVKPGPAADQQQDLGNLSVEDRWHAARVLLFADKFDKAAPEYLWLWRNMESGSPSTSGSARRTTFRAELELLAEHHLPTMATMVAERDALEATLRSDARTFHDLLDWIALNFVVKQEDRTLEWLDRIKGAPDAGPTLREAADLLWGLLRRRSRWADLVLITPDPVARVREVRMRHPELFHQEAAALYVAELATGHEDLAAQVAAAAISLNDTAETRVVLVQAAVDAGQARKAQGKLLDEAEIAGALMPDLRKQVEAAPK